MQIKIKAKLVIKMQIKIETRFLWLDIFFTLVYLPSFFFNL